MLLRHKLNMFYNSDLVNSGQHFLITEGSGLVEEMSQALNASVEAARMETDSL